MPFSAAQLAIGLNYTLNTYARVDPVDQINTERATLNWFLQHKQESLYGNGLYANPIFIDNGANYQRYFGAQQVTYNQRDPARQAKFAYVNSHVGFLFDEDTLRANNIVVNDESGLEGPTSLEKSQLINLLGQTWRASKEDMLNGLALDTLQSGAQSSLAVVGLDALVSTTPTAGTIGEIAASNTYWQNNISLSVAQADLINQMEIMWRACIKYGKKKPTKIIVGAAFLDDYRAAANVMINRQIHAGGNEKGGISLDPSTSTLYFKGLELTWDPMFEVLDAALGAITHPWTKRCYFLNDMSLTFRPYKGSWMVNRRPERLPDRYVHYAAKTVAFGMTINQRNSMAVLSID